MEQKMIKPINFLGQISKISFKGEQHHFHTKPMNCDCFIKNENSKADFESTSEYADKRIKQALDEQGIEYGFVISPEGEIIQEIEGSETKCPLDKKLIPINSAIKHGHPIETPFSPDDIAVFLSSNARSTEIITKNGKFCRLVKKGSCHPVKDFSTLHNQLDKELRLFVLDRLGINRNAYSINDVINAGRQIFKNTPFEQLSDAELLEKLNKLGINTQRPPKEVIEDLNRLIGMNNYSQPLQNDKDFQIIKSNEAAINAVLKSEEGIKLSEALVRQVAQDYDLIYETDLF